MISKFTDSEDNEDMIFRKVRDNIEIGICPMLSSFRIRAGVIGEGYCWIDYDAGKNINEIENIYSLCISIINKRMDSLDKIPANIIFHDFPRQIKKPMVLDHECFMNLDLLCGPEIISIRIKPEELQERKIKWAMSTSELNENPNVLGLMMRMGFFNED